MQEYHQARGSFPPLYVADKSGKPTLSWRILILPYMDQSDLDNFLQFRRTMGRTEEQAMVGDSARGLRLPKRGKRPRHARQADKLCSRGRAQRRVGQR